MKCSVCLINYKKTARSKEVYKLNFFMYAESLSNFYAENDNFKELSFGI